LLIIKPMAGKKEGQVTGGNALHQLPSTSTALIRVRLHHFFSCSNLIVLRSNWPRRHMISTRLSQLLCVSGFVFLLTGEASSQIYTETVTTGAGQNQSSRSYYMPKMFKVVQSDGTSVIMRFDGDYWISVDSKKKQYWQMSFAELEAKMKGMAKQMESAMQQMRKQMESMPPDQRRKMEQMMGPNLGASSTPGKLAVNKAGQSRTISGFSCSRYAITENGKEILVLWTTRDVPEFAAMRKDYERFAKSMAAMRNSAAGDSHGRAWAEAIKAVDGFPMETESAGINSTVTKLERKSTPASEFDPPAGYKKVAAPF
jgi:hypothetical protein